MGTPITFTTELTRERLLALRDEIDALLANTQDTASQPAGPEGATAGTSQYGAVMQGAARRLLRSLGPQLQEFVRSTVEKFDGQNFTWEDVAAALGEEVGTVKSWHRSLSKPMGRLMTDVPGLPAVIQGTGYDGRSHYVIGAGWNDAIAATWLNAGR